VEDGGVDRRGVRVQVDELVAVVDREQERPGAGDGDVLDEVVFWEGVEGGEGEGGLRCGTWFVKTGDSMVK
jgi:hypothetical protein